MCEGDFWSTINNTNSSSLRVDVVWEEESFAKKKVKKEKVCE